MRKISIEEILQGRTLQEAVVEAWDSLIAQGRQSKLYDGPDAMCRYRLDKTATCPIKCPIGYLIPDALYVPEMERQCVERLIEADENTINGLTSLQWVHDIILEFEVGNEILRRAERLLGLKPNSLKPLPWWIPPQK